MCLRCYYDNKLIILRMYLQCYYNNKLIIVRMGKVFQLVILQPLYSVGRG